MAAHSNDGTMLAMVLDRAGQPLRCEERPIPQPKSDQVLIRIDACAVCRTDLHILDGELSPSRFPLIPGHEIIGRIARSGGATPLPEGARVGVPWLAWTCGECPFCLSSRENLCDRARFTGFDLDGGFAEYTVADARFCFPIPERYTDQEAAPLMCAGLIGYRSLKLAGDAERLGIYGIGAAAHILIQVARHQHRRVFAFTRAGDDAGQEFARALGAEWAGGSDEKPPIPLDAAIIFAPVGSLIPAALRAVTKGGVVVCGGIHMSDIPSFRYQLLWGERVLRSVANLTRADAVELLALAPKVPVRTEIQSFPLTAANDALSSVRSGKVRGAAVLAIR